MPDSILRSIEENLDDFYITCGKYSNCNLKVRKHISWVKSIKGEWPDCIFRADFENLNVNKCIHNIKRSIIKKKIPNAWTIGPLTKPTNLGFFLRKNGFTNTFHQAGMALDLNKIKNIEQNRSNFNVIKINNESLLNQWIEIVSNVFQIYIDKDLIKLLFLKPCTIFYVGEFNKKLISALILHISSQVAGLHAVSTLSDYRGKGFALNLSRAALLHAYKQGIQLAVLQASKMGEKVYNKIGFEKYCDICSYTLSL
jgi:GNAT superfamily N-acetyltransferase